MAVHNLSAAQDDFFPSLPRLGPGMCLEFGVATGATLRKIATAFPSRSVYGFDSFEGLPEDWRGDGVTWNLKGTYACDPPVYLPNNVTLIKGLFQDTLSDFLHIHRGPVALLHMDADLFSSTIYVLNALRNRLDGTVIMFDELVGPSAYALHEGAAFLQFLVSGEFIVKCIGKQHESGGVFVVTRLR